MGVYAITFRVADKTTSLGSYETRYQSIVDNIQFQLSSNGTYWDETTSFFLIQSDEKNSNAIANNIYQDSKMDGDCDLLVVINLSQKGYRMIGNSSDGDIEKIMASR